ncbi:hypothetical protein [Saccharicrinis sp. FJH54]|uniref:hypothetical protein n=1 Tax=Saccharicrinis sp. FJH54 TaxID=3344665 RepID=UPI0035D3F0E2
MKENIDKLIKKYEAGESSLAEEKFLRDHAGQADSDHKPWFTFMQKTHQEVPQNLEKAVWKAVQYRRKRKRRINTGFLTAAASVAILLSLFVYNPQKHRLSYREKEAVLNEALSMFSAHNTTPQEAQNVLYEDDMIVIYLAQE